MYAWEGAVLNCSQKQPASSLCHMINLVLPVDLSPSFSGMAQGPQGAPRGMGPNCCLKTTCCRRVPRVPWVPTPYHAPAPAPPVGMTAGLPTGVGVHTKCTPSTASTQHTPVHVGFPGPGPVGAHWSGLEQVGHERESGYFLPVRYLSGVFCHTQIFNSYIIKLVIFSSSTFSLLIT